VAISMIQVAPVGVSGVAEMTGAGRCGVLRWICGASLRTVRQ